jgi:hypothetical protein
VRAVDNAGNVGSAASFTWLVDTTAPNLAITFPANGGTFSEASWNVGCTDTVNGDFCGTASDTGGSLLSSVQVSIKQESTGKYWTWTSGGFTSTTEQFSSVGAAATWTQAFYYANFPLTGSYTVHARATDNATNQTNRTSTFTLNRYAVDYQPPIDESIGSTVVINTGKNGRVIPVNVNVYLEGVNQSSTQIAEGRLTIKVSGVTCGSQAALDPVETYADAGASNGNTDWFRANGTGWIYNLDTTSLKLVTGKCYRLDVYLDGVRISTQQYAIFQPVK